VSETVDGGGAKQPVGESLAPFGKIEVAGDDGGVSFVTLRDEVMEVFVLRRTKRF